MAAAPRQRSQGDAASEAGGEAGPVFTRPNVARSLPRRATKYERELASLWQGLLGVSSVGIDDDFFELGGQSLVAVRLFQRIGKKYGVDMPLSTLFQAPTIAQCATLLRDMLGRPHPGDAEAAAPEPSDCASCRGGGRCHREARNSARW